MRRSDTILACLFAIGTAAAVAAAFINFGNAMVGTLVTLGAVAAGYYALRCRRAGKDTKAQVDLQVSADAARLGFQPLEVVGHELRKSLRRIPGVPGNADVGNVIEGEIGGQHALVYQLRHLISTGQTVVPIYHTVFRCEAPQWPTTHLTPRGWLGRVLMKLGHSPPLLLENDGFNRRFRIKATNEDFAVTLLTPTVQQHLLGKTNVRWIIEPGSLSLVYGGAMKSARLERSVRRVAEFWSLIARDLLAW